MPDEPNSITTMKKHYTDRLYVPERDDLWAELMDGNDRSLIITLASLAESAVEALVGRNLPSLKECSEKEFNYAFRHEGPLGTFSACIDMAFYLELIDTGLRVQLHALRDMRNAAAHTKRKVTLDDSQLKNVAKRIIHPKGMFRLLNDTHDGIRRTLASEGLLICSILAFGRDEAVRKCRESFAAQGREAPF